MKLKTWGLYNETIQYQIPMIKQNLTNYNMWNMAKWLLIQKHAHFAIGCSFV